MSSSEEEVIDSEPDSISEDDQIVSENSSEDEEENPQYIDPAQKDTSISQNINYATDELDNPEIFNVNLHETHNKLKQFHPESKVANYKEIKIFTRIKKENGIIVDPIHRTLPILSKYERTKILGQRAKQIEDGDTPYITTNNIIDPYIIASMELEEKKIPFIIRRPLPNGASEYWNLNDLLII